jgi:hypothetical protein
MKSVALATEDELSEAVGLRLLEEALHRLHVGLLFRKGGSGYLRSNVSKWCALAKLQPLLLLTDLDRSRCPSALIPDWLGEYSQPKDLVLRIAVREVEAWLLADHEAMRRLLGNKGKFPVDPDALPDPKQRLLELAKHAKRDVRQDLVAEKGAIAAQGIAYNSRLCEFVKQDWDPRRASIRSESLRRAQRRIDELSARLYAR